MVTPPHPAATPPGDPQPNQGGDTGSSLPRPLIKDHELIRQIGEGSFGVVWLCRNAVAETYRGAKVVYRQRFKRSDPYERELSGIKQFEPISRSHKGLVHVLQIGQEEADGYFYYVMEVADDVATGQVINPGSYIPKTLKTIMETAERLPLPQTIKLGISLTEALGYMHARNLIHRDVKPSNIIFVSNEPKLADIGLVTKVAKAGTLIGTIGYMPAEGCINPSADLFGLGRILYEIGTGQDLDEFPSLPKDLFEGRDYLAYRGLNEVIVKACARDPRMRYQNAREMRKDLVALLNAGSATSIQSQPATRHGEPEVVIIHKSNLKPDADLVEMLEETLRNQGLNLFIDRSQQIELSWMREMERRIRDADAVIGILSEDSARSEMVAYDLQVAHAASQENPAGPVLLPVRLGWTGTLPPALAPFLGGLRDFTWNGTEDDEELVSDLLHAIRAPKTSQPRPRPSEREPAGGAVPIDSPFYVERPTDAAFFDAIGRKDSIVLVKGARQIGKTSLLARGLQKARLQGFRVVLTDFQKLDANHLSSPKALFLKWIEMLSDQLELDVFPEENWDDRRSANMNFERFLRRQVLAHPSQHLVWGMDEVDRLFSRDFASDVFGLFRAWHNERALDPECPWKRLTLAISYATEAHLFIRDPHQSPFNVGTRLTLEDFDIHQVRTLNQAHGAPLQEQELTEFHELVGGHPYLVRHALNEIAFNNLSFQDFKKNASQDEGLFGDHLRRIMVLMARDPDLCDVVRDILRGQPCRDMTSFYRLRSAGITRGDTPGESVPRCKVYAQFLKRHLLPS